MAFHLIIPIALNKVSGEIKTEVDIEEEEKEKVNPRKKDLRRNKRGKKDRNIQHSEEAIKKILALLSKHIGENKKIYHS